MKNLIKYILIINLALIFNLFGLKQAYASTATISATEDGLARLTFQNDYSDKVKLVVQLSGGKQYKYDIPKGSVDINIPMTQGNGEYKFILCRNISGNKYAVIQTATVTQKLADDDSMYLSSHLIVNWDKTNAAIKKAQELAKSGGEKNKVKYIYEYVIKNYDYDYKKADKIDELNKSETYVPDIDNIYNIKKGICYDYSVLLATMLRSVGVPTKVVTGYTTQMPVYHAWNNIYLNSKWNVVDPTLDSQEYKSTKKYTWFRKANEYKDVMYTY